MRAPVTRHQDGDLVGETSLTEEAPPSGFLKERRMGLAWGRNLLLLLQESPAEAATALLSGPPFQVAVPWVHSYDCE